MIKFTIMDILERFKKVTSPVLGLYFDNFEVVKAKGCYVYDRKGNKYLDFSSGIATTVIGHCHPYLVKKVNEQIKKLIHICIGVALYEPYIKLGEELQKILPFKDGQIFCCQSGSEAVEAALKLAKYVQKKPGIIAFKGAFHGRTMGALSITTSKAIYRDGYEPFLPESYILPFDLSVVEGVIEQNIEKIAAVIIEPILGEGGYQPVDPKFMAGLRKLCSKYNVLMIADEVQTGIGHTGKWFAVDHYKVVPDIIVLAKAIASGFPLGICAAPSEIMKNWPPGSHGSTFGGNPVCCTAAIATLQVIKKNKLVAKAKVSGDYLKKKLLKIMEEYPIIKDVRGIGLMIGVDFKDNKIVKKIMKECLNNGLLLISTGSGGEAIRFVPALNVTKQQIDQALNIFESVVKNASL
jgi:4-aminobutyrate aminotransferase